MRNDSYGFKRVAHRGASGEAPENTLPAIELAVEKYKVDVVEIDLQISKEGIPVVFHDATLERTTNGKGPVQAQTLTELKTLDAGFGFDPEGRGAFPYRGKGVTVPTLEEVLRKFPDTSFCLEIKEKEVKIAQRVLEVTQRIQRKGPILIGSFHGKITREIRRLAPASIETTLSQNEVIQAYLAFRLHFKRSRPPSRYAFLPPKKGKIRLDDPTWIAYLHEQGIRVFYWTVNEDSEMEKLLNGGADGILTDYPGRLNQILEK